MLFSPFPRSGLFDPEVLQARSSRASKRQSDLATSTLLADLAKRPRGAVQSFVPQPGSSFQNSGQFQSSRGHSGSRGRRRGRGRGQARGRGRGSSTSSSSTAAPPSQGSGGKRRF